MAFGETCSLVVPFAVVKAGLTVIFLPCTKCIILKTKCALSTCLLVRHDLGRLAPAAGSCWKEMIMLFPVSMALLAQSWDVHFGVARQLPFQGFFGFCSSCPLRI